MLVPRGKTLARHEKPGPYDTVADAIEGLKSPNLATQFLAREKLLADGSESVIALRSLLADPEPNFRARALWVLDRIGAEARGTVVEQLKSPDASLRALAVRILRRHGAEYQDAILELSGDPADEVRREVLLAIRNFKSDKAMAALASIAATYDGTDRYQLEAINIAAGKRRKAQLLALLREIRATIRRAVSATDAAQSEPGDRARDRSIGRRQRGRQVRRDPVAYGTEHSFAGRRKWVARAGTGRLAAHRAAQ